MRKFKIDKLININTEKIKPNMVIELIPEIKKKYFIEGVEFRCSEHKLGFVVLKNDKQQIVYLMEIF